MKPQPAEKRTVAPQVPGWLRVVLPILILLVVVLSASFQMDAGRSAPELLQSTAVVTSAQPEAPPCEGHGDMATDDGCCVMSAGCGAGIPAAAYAVEAQDLATKPLLPPSDALRGNSPELQFRPPRLSA